MRRSLHLLLLPVLSACLSACSGADLLNATISESGLTVERDTAYAPGPRRMLDIYRPRAGGGGLPLVVFIYGGSWRFGSKSMYPFVAASLARRGAVVMVADYRMFPEVAFPSFLHDNAQAAAWAIAHAGEYGADPHAVFLMGHSAGAYNVAMLGLDPHYLAEAGTSRSAIAGVIGIAGPYDFLPITDPEVIPVFAPVMDGPLSQPVHYVDGHAPPMLLLAGTADTTVQPRNTQSLADRITAAGGSVQAKFYPGLGHIGMITAFAPLFQVRAPVLDDVWAFILAHRPAASG